MWIWLAMLDLKAHVFRGHELHDWRGSVQVLFVVRALLTAAGFYLNAVFAFAISQPGEPKSGRRSSPGATSASCSGSASGRLALGVSAVVVPRWGCGGSVSRSASCSGS